MKRGKAGKMVKKIARGRRERGRVPVLLVSVLNTCESKVSEITL